MTSEGDIPTFILTGFFDSSRRPVYYPRAVVVSAASKYPVYRYRSSCRGSHGRYVETAVQLYGDGTCVWHIFYSLIQAAKVASGTSAKRSQSQSFGLENNTKIYPWLLNIHIIMSFDKDAYRIMIINDSIFDL